MALLVSEIVSGAAAAVPRHVAVTLDGVSRTFGELAEKSRRTANALVGCGVRRGDVIAHWAGMSLRSTEIFNAAALLGAAYVPLNPAFGPDELRANLAYVDPRVVVVDGTHAEAAVEVTRDLRVPMAVVEPTARLVAGV